MSLQWTFIATFLYTEIFLCVLLMLPIISPSRWQKIFKSRLLSSLTSYANLYFNIFIVILVILFIDSTREAYKYSDPPGPDVNNPASEALQRMKLFRSQRNLYISGFSVFMAFILRKLVTTISSLASAQADAETMKKQAESANAVAKQLMEDRDNKSNEKEEGSSKKAVADVADTKELDKLREELSKANKDMEAMRKQAESVNREYDRLLGEYAGLQDKYKEIQGGGESKKDE